MVPRFGEEALSQAEFERVGVAQSVGMRPLVDSGLAGEAGRKVRICDGGSEFPPESR